MVGENNGTEPTAVDQASGLKGLLPLLKDDLSTVWYVSSDGTRVLPISALIDLQELLGDILDTTSLESDHESRIGNEEMRTL